MSKEHALENRPIKPEPCTCTKPISFQPNAFSDPQLKPQLPNLRSPVKLPEVRQRFIETHERPMTRDVKAIS